MREPIQQRQGGRLPVRSGCRRRGPWAGGGSCLLEGCVDPDGAVAAELFLMHCNPVGFRGRAAVQGGEQACPREGMLDGLVAVERFQLEHAAMAGQGKIPEALGHSGLFQKLRKLTEKVVSLARQ